VPRQLFYFDQPRRFVVGTVGQPGERVFFLQAADAGRLVSVALEKMQVNVLVERMEQLLEQVQDAPDHGPIEPDVDPLESPIDEEFRVGAMALAYDGEHDLIVIEAQGPTDDNDMAEATLLEDVDEGPDALRVRLGRKAALSFIERARRVVAAGRPPCPLCEQPLDPSGHVCPRYNGYRRTPIS
jgi:uncharacterized repeat protein (TIGR03847 family)